jgi:hypothetical protein
MVWGGSEQQVPFDFAQGRLCGDDKQERQCNDNNKCNGNDTDKYRDPSLRSG